MLNYDLLIKILFYYLIISDIMIIAIQVFNKI